MIGLGGMKKRRVWKSPALFLWLARLRQLGVLGIARAVFGEQLLAYFKPWRMRLIGDFSAAVVVKLCMCAESVLSAMINQWRLPSCRR